MLDYNMMVRSLRCMTIEVRDLPIYGGFVGGGGGQGIHCLIKLIVLLGETFTSSSSLSVEVQSRGYFLSLLYLHFYRSSHFT